MILCGQAADIFTQHCTFHDEMNKISHCSKYVDVLWSIQLLASEVAGASEGWSPDTVAGKICFDGAHYTEHVPPNGTFIWDGRRWVEWS